MYLRCSTPVIGCKTFGKTDSTHRQLSTKEEIAQNAPDDNDNQSSNGVTDAPNQSNDEVGNYEDETDIDHDNSTNEHKAIADIAILNKVPDKYRAHFTTDIGNLQKRVPVCMDFWCLDQIEGVGFQEYGPRYVWTGSQSLLNQKDQRRYKCWDPGIWCLIIIEQYGLYF